MDLVSWLLRLCLTKISYKNINRYTMLVDGIHEHILLLVRSLGKPSMSGSVFYGRDGNQNRNRTVFGSVRFFPVEMEIEIAARFGFFQSTWKPKVKSNRFQFSVRFFPVDMETKSEIEPLSVFGSVFSGRDGNQNRNRIDFGFRLGSVFSGQDGNQNRNRNVFDFRLGFFGFPVLVSRFFRFRFVLVFAHLTLYNSIPIPSNQTRPKCVVKFHQIPFQFF